MVKLAVRYDKKLNENVFVIRDDESYVSTTKTILTVSEEYYATYSTYRVDVTINVLREIGTSKVVVYDGEEILDSLSWNGVPISTHYDFPVGTTHTLKAIFMGNKNCLKSHSKTFEVSMDSSNETLIEYDYYPIIANETSFNFNVTDSGGFGINEGTLTVSFTDGIISDIQTVDVDYGVATVDFSSSLVNVSRGLLNFTAVYNGTETYARAESKFQVSKYYATNLEGYLEYTTSGGSYNKYPGWVRGEDYTLVGSVVDYMGNPCLENQHVYMYGYDANDDWELISDGYINSNGEFKVTLGGFDYKDSGYVRFEFVTNMTHGLEFLNVDLTPSKINVTRIDFEYIGLVGNDYKFYAYVYGDSPESTNSRLGGVPVSIWSDPEVHRDVYASDSQGKATCEYGKEWFNPGVITVNVKAGVITTKYPVVVGGALIDYVAPNWKGMELSLSNVNKQSLQTGMKYSGKTNVASYIYLPLREDLMDYSQRFTFTVVSATDAPNARWYYAAAYKTVVGSFGIMFTGTPHDNWLGAGDTVEYYYDASKKSITCTALGRKRFEYTFGDFDFPVYYPAIAYISKDGILGEFVLNNIKYEVVI